MVDGPARSASRIRRHGGFRRLLAGVCTLAFALPALTIAQSQPSHADERDDAANQTAQAGGRVDQLRQDLQGIDANLAEIYIQLDQLKQQIPVAEQELADATQRREAAEREHQIATEQLEASQGEQTRLTGEVEDARQRQDEAVRAIGGMAREMYRGGVTSPIVAVFSAGGTQGINQRAAAADVLAKSQDQALERALSVENTQRNQVARQEAITERITELEATARTAAETAAAAAQEAEAKVLELATLQEQATAKQAEWDSQRATAAQQLQQAEAEHREASARLAQLDAAARQRLAEQQAAAAASGGSSGSSSGSYATGSSGFVSPLPIPLYVTSPFGPRFHPVLGVWRNHLGTDFGANCGVPVLSIAPGIVSAVYYNESGGNIVFVNHGNRGGVEVSSAYLHLSAQSVSVGQWVDAGQQVGLVGTTGYSTGCHLHLSIMHNGIDVDPMNYL